MHERHAKGIENDARERARLSNRLQQLEKWIEQAYIDKIEGKISEDHWQRATQKWDHEAEQICMLLDNSNVNSEEKLQIAEKILKLAQKLPTLWDSRNNYDKRKLADLLYSNYALDGRSLCLTYRKPFYCTSSDKSDKLVLKSKT